MVFVQRQDGKIIGIYSNFCEGIAEEELPDDNAEVLAFLNPPPSVSEYQNAVQKHVDDTAVSKQYADGVALATYKDSTVPLWAAQATAFIAWRDQVWTFAYDMLAKVQAGQVPQPTIDELIAELPAITWPPG